MNKQFDTSISDNLSLVIQELVSFLSAWAIGTLFQILDMEKQISAQRKAMGGTNNSTAKNIAIQKKKAVLENRLDKVLINRRTE